jgi:hypothetical protein
VNSLQDFENIAILFGSHGFPGGDRDGASANRKQTQGTSKRQ